MCYPVCGMMYIKDPLLLNGKSRLCGNVGPLSLSGPVPYIRGLITINKMCSVHH